MDLRCLAVVVVLAMSACMPAPSTALTRRSEATAACPVNASAMDGWSERAPPQRIFGNSWYVGTCGISSILITSDQGHLLIDGATEAAGPLIEANIRALGFDPHDIRYIVNSHEHFDHAGGIDYLQRATGAEVRLREPAIASFQRGQSDRGDPQFLDRSGVFPPVSHIVAVADGETLRVGPLALTAHATPGHTPGGTSWSWRSCDGQRCLDMAYVDSLSAISDSQYRYGPRPDVVDAFYQSFDTVAALACDILMTPHPSASQWWARMDGAAPLIDADACRRIADKGRHSFEKRLRDEQSGAAP